MQLSPSHTPRSLMPHASMSFSSSPRTQHPGLQVQASSTTPSITNSPDSIESQSPTSQPQQTQLLMPQQPQYESYDALKLLHECERLGEPEKRQTIVDKLYQFIEMREPLLCAKITGMIIHKQSTAKLFELLCQSHINVLDGKIHKATHMLLRASDNTLYATLYTDLSRLARGEARTLYLRRLLYPRVEAYVKQDNLANIITQMLLQLQASEVVVLLNEKDTLQRRMDGAIKAYLEWNADLLNKLKQIHERAA